MRKIIVSLSATLMALGTLGAAPATANPLQYGGAEFTNAQFSFNYDDGDWDRYRDDDWDDDRYHDRFEQRGEHYYFNGHRGERHRRHGWKQHNGYWFPPAAFSFSITVGPNRGKLRLSVRHRDWCEDRYISYRASDNTFKPRKGKRKQCISPFMR